MAKADDLTPEQFLRREVATLRASQAPVLFFEAACTFGVLNGVCSMTLDTGESTTVEGEALTFTEVEGNIKVDGTQGSSGFITQADVEQSNGNIHVINGVLMPTLG